MRSRQTGARFPQGRDASTEKLKGGFRPHPEKGRTYTQLPQRWRLERKLRGRKGSSPEGEE